MKFGHKKLKVNTLLLTTLSLLFSFSDTMADNQISTSVVPNLISNVEYEEILDNKKKVSNDLNGEKSTTNTEDHQISTSVLSNLTSNIENKETLNNDKKVSNDLNEKKSITVSKDYSKILDNKNKSKKEKNQQKKNNNFSFVLKKFKKISSDSVKLPGKLLSRLAHKILFCGVKDDKEHIENMKKKFEVEEVNLSWKIGDKKKDKLNLHGYIFKPKSDDYDTVCICFGSDMNPCHRMVTKDSYDKILYVCIDYPSFGSSDYLYLDENKMFAFDDFIYNYVSEKYKDKKLIALGFSLGGFGASYMSQKERISEVYLISPVYLPGIMSKKLCDSLFGYELSFIKNLENCNHKCNVYITSGDKSDFLSLYYTLIYYFYDELKEKDINDQIKECVKLLKKNKNLTINYKIEDGYDHYNIHPHAIAEFYKFFSHENNLKKEILFDSEKNKDTQKIELVA